MRDDPFVLVRGFRWYSNSIEDFRIATCKATAEAVRSQFAKPSSAVRGQQQGLRQCDHAGRSRAHPVRLLRMPGTE